MKKSRYKDPLRLLIALFLSSFCAVLAVLAVSIEHDWGFNLVIKLLGEPRADSLLFVQFALSYYLKFCCVPMMMAGLVFGYLKNYWKGRVGWRIAGSILIFPIWFWFFLDWSSCGENPLEAIVLPGIPTILFYGCMWLGESLFREVANRTRPLQIFLPGLLALLIPLTFCIISNGEISSSWLVNSAIDGLTIYTAAFGAAMLCSRKEPSSSVVAAMVTTLPFILFNLLNMGNNLLFLSSLGDEGFGATLSSLLITLLYIAAICGGAFSGRYFSLRMSRK